LPYFSLNGDSTIFWCSMSSSLDEQVRANPMGEI
jgi:hypothetical protein